MILIDPSGSSNNLIKMTIHLALRRVCIKGHSPCAEPGGIGGRGSSLRKGMTSEVTFTRKSDIGQRRLTGAMCRGGQSGGFGPEQRPQSCERRLHDVRDYGTVIRCFRRDREPMVHRDHMAGERPRVGPGCSSPRARAQRNRSRKALSASAMDAAIRWPRRLCPRSPSTAALPEQAHCLLQNLALRRMPTVVPCPEHAARLATWLSRAGATSVRTWAEGR